MHAYAEPFKWQMFEIWKSWGFGFKKEYKPNKNQQSTLPEGFRKSI